MSIKLIVAPKVKFKVKGVFTNEAGVDQPFDFFLVCKRLDADEINDQIKNKTMADIVKDNAEDWSGPIDESGVAIPFSADALDALFRLPGVATLAFKAYLENNGAKEKN